MLSLYRTIISPSKGLFFGRRFRQLPFSQRNRTISSVDKSITFGDITVSDPPQGSNRHDLIPPLDSSFLETLPPPFLNTLRWMLQKDMVLGQDFCLLSQSAADRRLLAFGYAALTQREVEYVGISRDTVDADLKQRKMITGGVSEYTDQGPVRAARNGRLLILDGIEKAERNVLPTLNNLLENRCLSLDDGSLLVDSNTFRRNTSNSLEAEESTVTLHQVHKDFRVLALASADHATELDPPLRSRFQAHTIPTLEAGHLLESMAKRVDANKVSLEQLQELVEIGSNSFSMLSESAAYLEQNPGVAVNNVVRTLDGRGVKTVYHSSSRKKSGKSSIVEQKVSSPFVMTDSTRNATKWLLQSVKMSSRGVAIVSPKGAGKSALVSNLARQEGKTSHLFSLVADMTARDLFLRRATNEAGDTIWQPTPLTEAIEKGTWVFLDGIDKLNTDTLTCLGELLQLRQVSLPDGRRVTPKDGFGCIALANPGKKSWVTAEVASLFHWIEIDHLPSHELVEVLGQLFPEIEGNLIRQLVNIRDQLDHAVKTGAADSAREEEGINLSLRKLKHICKRLNRGVRSLSVLVEDALMTDLMHDREKQVVRSCLQQSGVQLKEIDSGHHDSPLDEALIARCRRVPQQQNSLLVPRPRFQSNPAHQKALHSLLEAHAVGERALLVMGYQGVGKNKVIDHLLYLLNAEREYVQLHRDTTIQSMVSTPVIDQGRIFYHDSPLVRAAVNGLILVIDEADKAPVEVVAMLKGLIEDGELALLDGRTLKYEPDKSDDNEVQIHPDFRVWALANPTGYPFHGNDLAREMSDIFSCHTIPPLDSQSQFQVLQSYGPRMAKRDISRIVEIWKELMTAHVKGQLGYPFSVREAVSVVKHLNEFPKDGIATAIENVVAFDRSDITLMKMLASILEAHGVETSFSQKRWEPCANQVSTPRTRAGDPKHGKIDPDNTPHVGGNTWYGGTGGSDTAGLGGRGGPYRVDLGHPVHQISDEMKDQVSKKAIEKAQAIAKEELAKKLDSLNLGEYDWQRYNSLRSQVALQIDQLRTHLKDVRLRKEQRTWLKRQTSGELDDSRLCETIAGERDVFKKRGTTDDSHFASNEPETPILIKLVVDVSASMYRFNSFDGRLERLLESTLMIMEALKDDDRFRLEIMGHNGSSHCIPLLTTSMNQDEAVQLKILETMIAHTQYTEAGDSTMEAIQSAMEKAQSNDLILIISDANLQRYYIEPDEVANLLQNAVDVHSHLILVSSLGREAYELADRVPNGRAQVCLDSSELPLMLKKIVSSAV